MSSPSQAKTISFNRRVSDFPQDVPRPSWLHSNYLDDRWTISGTGPNPTQNIYFNLLMSDGSRLTAPQHFELLDTVRRMAIALRAGPYATVTDNYVHMAMTNNIVNWVLWMDLNGIRSFRKLIRADFEAFVERAIFGTFHLLEYAARIKQHISKLKASGGKVPRRDGRFLDTSRLLADANIDWTRARHDHACTHQLWKLAEEEGLYLNPFKRQHLKTEPAQPSRTTQVNLLRLLQPWEFQWQIRRTLPGDKIGFDPFPSLSISKTVEKLGIPKGRTRTAPVYQTMVLIDRSIRWVLDYSKAIQAMAQQADVIAAYHGQPFCARHRRSELSKLFDNLQMPQGPGQPWPIRPTLICPGSYHKGSTEVLRCLFASCFVVIAAFTARRRKEVTSCRAAGSDNEFCITSNQDGHWIELWIEKTKRDWDKTPCPEIVVKAVEVLVQLSESARKINEKPQLFQYKLWGRSKTASFRILKALRELTDRLDIPPLPDGSTWKFQPHQFRRFFAIMYIWRYEFGELSALSYQLRHYHLDVTRRYLTESIHGKIFREVQSEHTVSILKEVALGRRDAGGPFGERFKKIAERIRAQMIASVHVFTEEKFASQIERLVLRSGKVLKGFPWGYCTCGSSPRDLSQAKCVQSDSSLVVRGPDESKATLTTCASCPHHLTHEAFRPYVANQIELHEKASKAKNNGLLVRNASTTYLSELRNYRDRSFGPSENGRLSNAQNAENTVPEDRNRQPTRSSGKDRGQKSNSSTIRKKRNAKRSVRAKIA
jgi:hypothetical protein